MITRASALSYAPPNSRGVAAGFYLGVGLWAFAAPLSFLEHVGPYPPYNEHFIHDGGAFSLGLGGHPSDPYTLGGVALAVLVGLIAPARSVDSFRLPTAQQGR